MPVTLTQIANNTASVTFPYAGDTLTVVYYPDHVTDKELAALIGFENMTGETVLGGLVSLNETLVQLIKSWDAFEDDACTLMIPIEETRLARLSVTFRTAVLRGITSDMRPN